MFCANSPSLWQKSAGEISEGALETGGTAHLQSMSKIEPQTVRRRKSDSGCHGMPWDAVSRDTFGDFYDFHGVVPFVPRLVRRCAQ